MTKLATIVASAPLRAGMTGTAVRTLQTALRAAGHELVVDGDFGKITLEAVRRLQAANGLALDGIVGPRTAAALDALPSARPVDPAPSTLKIAPWLTIARALTGTREIPGARSNPLIIGWRDDLIADYPAMKPNLNWYVNDDTPWCGLFAAHCIGEAKIAPPVAPLWALNWASWGDRLSEPVLGAVLVFVRDGGGHVGFYENQDATTYHVRGGNQSNAVTLTRIAKSRLAKNGIRWPRGAPLATVQAGATAADDEISRNEA